MLAVFVTHEPGTAVEGTVTRIMNCLKLEALPSGFCVAFTGALISQHVIDARFATLQTPVPVCD